MLSRNRGGNGGRNDGVTGRRGSGFPSPRRVAMFLVASVGLLTAGCSAGPDQAPLTPSSAGASTASATSTPSGTASSPTDSPSASPTVLSPTATPGTASSGSASSAPASSGPARRAAALVRGMSRAQRVGQVLMVGVPLDGPAEQWEQTLRGQRIGNVFLAGRSEAGTDAVGQRTASLRTAATAKGVRPWIATDQEGGEVQTLSGPGFSTIPRGITQGGWSTEQLRTEATAWGKELAAAGIDMNLAPVAGTVPAGTAARNAPIGAFGREFGSSPSSVRTHAEAFAAGQRAAGVTPVLKHFPGLGAVRGNTDTDRQVTDTTTTEDGARVGVFADLIDAGADWVMVSSATYTRIDPDHLAAFSPEIITHLLRERLGFDGTVVSDDLCTAQAVRAVPLVTRASRYLEAGGDLFLCAGKVSRTTVRDLAEGMTSLAGRDADFDAALTRAATRVVASKLGE